MGTHGSILIHNELDSAQVELHTTHDGHSYGLLEQILRLPKTLVALSKIRHRGLWFYSTMMLDIDKFKKFNDLLARWELSIPLDTSGSPAGYASFLICQNPKLFVLHRDMCEDFHLYDYWKMDPAFELTITDDVLTNIVIDLENFRDDELEQVIKNIEETNSKISEEKARFIIKKEDKIIIMPFDARVAYEMWEDVKGAE